MFKLDLPTYIEIHQMINVDHLMMYKKMILCSDEEKSLVGILGEILVKVGIKLE